MHIAQARDDHYKQTLMLSAMLLTITQDPIDLDCDFHKSLQNFFTLQQRPTEQVAVDMMNGGLTAI